MKFFKSFEFIALLAMLMGLSALGIDAVLPAFGAISRVFGLEGERANSVQLVVYVFMFGFASMQLFFGIMADFLGRKVLLLAGLALYIAASLSIVFINDFNMLLAARFVQGAGLAAPRVLSQAVVRDVVSGREMSRIMSFTMLVFLLVPIFAPAIGQFAINLGDWHNIFYLFVLLGVIVLTWTALRLPETLPKTERKPPNFAHIGSALKICLTHKPTLIYTVMLGFMFAMMMTYIGQAEQIYGRDVYGLGDKFALAFAVTALGMVAASFCNASVVMRLGMHRIVFFSLLLMLAGDIVLVALSVMSAGNPPLPLFMALLILHLFCFSMTMPNLNSLILEPFSHIAGTVSAVVGTLMTVLGVALGSWIAQHYNATVLPLAFGWLALSFASNILNMLVIRLTKNGNPLPEGA